MEDESEGEEEEDSENQEEDPVNEEELSNDSVEPLEDEITGEEEEGSMNQKEDPVNEDYSLELRIQMQIKLTIKITLLPRQVITTTQSQVLLIVELTFFSISSLLMARPNSKFLVFKIMV